MILVKVFIHRHFLILANISYRLGRELKFMGDYEKFANDPKLTQC